MQLDFHFDVIYILARCAGFTGEDANIIAHSSQYVDDAEHGGIIKFSNHPAYYHIRTAHDTLDRENIDTRANYNTLVPFHFLPGGVCDGGEMTAYVSKIICRANSGIANEMMRECIRRKYEPNGLHRLGIGLHVYADTWAHQNFAGISDRINRTESVERNGRLKLNITHAILNDWLPLGHGTVRLYPDIPYLKWSYTDYAGNRHSVTNYERYLEAADEIYRYLVRYQTGSPDARVEGLPDDIRIKIGEKLKNIRGGKRERHQEWQTLIGEGYFCGKDRPFPYISSGPDSWKGVALNTGRLNDRRIYTVNASFDNSDWKFHDAAKNHLNYVLFKLLPENGIVF